MDINEPFERFSYEKLDSLRARYRGDALFRAWTPTLCRLESAGGLNAVEIWSETELIRQKLAEVNKEYRDSEIYFLYERLKQRHQSERRALVILAVLFIQFCDRESDPDKDNTPECRALAQVFMYNPNHEKFVRHLIWQLTESRKTDNNGNKIVLPVTDYMNVKSPLELMDADAKAQIEACVEDIANLTHGIKIYLSVGWDTYRNIWREICAIQEIPPLLNQKSPNSQKNKWGKNLKLVANVLGIMANTPVGETTILTGNVNTINNSINCANIRSYISNHADYEGSNSALTKELHKKIENMIKSTIAKP